MGKYLDSLLRQLNSRPAGLGKILSVRGGSYSVNLGNGRVILAQGQPGVFSPGQFVYLAKRPGGASYVILSAAASSASPKIVTL